MLKYYEDDLVVNGIKLHYYRTGGDKPPCVLLHGSADSGLCWLPVAEWLSAEYDVIMPDAQGHGKSDRLTPDFKSTDMADQAASLMQQFNLKNPLLMGHSMGADTIVDLIMLYPSLPSAVILEDPIWQIQDVSGQADQRLQKRRQKMVQAVTDFREKSGRELLLNGRLANPTWSEDELRYWAESKKQFDSSLFTGVKDKRFTFHEFVGRADCPTLLITSQWGAVSREIALEAQKLWKSQHLFRWALIPDAGHNIRRDQPAIFKKTALEFLEKLR